MSVIRGTIQAGKVVLDRPVSLPDGTEVQVELVGNDEYLGIGMREEDWPTQVEQVEALIARMDKIQPFLSPEDEAEWHKALDEQKAWELANWDKNWKAIEDTFK